MEKTTAEEIVLMQHLKLILIDDKFVSFITKEDAINALHEYSESIAKEFAEFIEKQFQCVDSKNSLYKELDYEAPKKYTLTELFTLFNSQK